jgi:hypothetical protein
MPARLAQVFFKLAIDRDHLLGNHLVLAVRVANFGLQIIITGLLVLVEAINVFEKPLIKGLCLILGPLETLLQIFERVDLSDIEVLRVCILLGSLDPVNQVRLASDLLVILVEGDDLLRNAMNDLLL